MLYNLDLPHIIPLKKLEVISEIKEKLSRALALTYNTQVGHPVPLHYKRFANVLSCSPDKST